MMNGSVEKSRIPGGLPPFSLRKHIITVTLNPVLDKTLWVPHFSPGNTFLARRSVTFAGGKGVNVSRALHNLGIASTITGIVASGGMEAYLSIIQDEGMNHEFVAAEGRLRTNITIMTDDSREETHIREQGHWLTLRSFDALEARLEQLVRGGGARDTLVVLAGSLPRGFPHSSYRDLIEDTRSWGAEACLDASGPPLKPALQARPSLIKPNLAEVEDALGFLPRTEDDILEAVRLLHDSGVGKVMITMGVNGLVFSEGREVVGARITVSRPLSTVGSGDAALAGVIAGTAGDLDTERTARLACALGAVNTLRAGACLFDVEAAGRLYAEAEISIIGRV